MNYRKIYENHYGPIPKDECGKVGKHRAAYSRFHGEKCRWGVDNG